MTSESEPQRLLRAEQAADSARALAHRQEASHHAGVAWSGLGPDPFRHRTAKALQQNAADRLVALQRWRLTRPARLLAAMVEAERAVETVRDCVARGLAVSDARCGLALGALERAAAAARQAMDADPPDRHSGVPCVTNTASSNRSTPSPTPSAG